MVPGGADSLETFTFAWIVMPAQPTKPKGRQPAKPVSRKTADSAEVKSQAKRVLRRLKADYPDANCALEHRTAFHLLVATILSAQCTDERVNKVTKDLFRQYKKPADFAAAPIKDLEKAIQSTGFFRNKAKNIKACSIQLVEEHGGEVPQDLDSLVKLAGVGRKTANVVLGTAFGISSGVVVDTHVGRLSTRLGLTTQKDAVKIEQDLMQVLPKTEWVEFSHRMIFHGRQVCASRKPACDRCSMESFCPKVGVSR